MKNCSFQPAQKKIFLFSWWRSLCWLKATMFHHFLSWSMNFSDVYWSCSSADEGHCADWKLQYFIIFHRDLRTSEMSDSSQVGVPLFPSYCFFYHFTFPGFPFIVTLNDELHKVVLGSHLTEGIVVSTRNILPAHSWLFVPEDFVVLGSPLWLTLTFIQGIDIICKRNRKGKFLILV